MKFGYYVAAPPEQSQPIEADLGTLRKRLAREERPDDEM